eukprot:m.187963 g.187963  ORF g.187963 m.187963 type:complete len:69 (-) comp10554_c1_seq1:3390-3596(-)
MLVVSFVFSTCVCAGFSLSSKLPPSPFWRRLNASDANIVCYVLSTRFSFLSLRNAVSSRLLPPNPITG